MDFCNVHISFVVTSLLNAFPFEITTSDIARLSVDCESLIPPFECVVKRSEGKCGHVHHVDEKKKKKN